MPTLDALRRYAVARSLFAPTTLGRAIEALGFVQADPIRAPARAQDLTLRHRVKGYVAGDLERRYPRLEVQEDFFVNYGFLPSAHWATMHPRSATQPWNATTRRRAAAILDFVRNHGSVHPRAVDAHFAHGSVTNYWGGASNATTHLLDAMHYRGLLRVVRRDSGVRIYAAHVHPPRPRDMGARRARLDTLVDLIVHQYAPLPATSLWNLVARLRHAVPQEHAELRPALLRARSRLAHARIDGVDWYWPRGGGRGGRRRAPAGTLAPPGAFRPRGLGPAPLRDLLGLALSLRGLRTGTEASLGLLRAAAALG